MTAHSPAVIHYYTHFPVTIITHVGGSHGVNTGPPFLHQPQKILFKDRALCSNLLQPKRRLTTPLLPILEPVLKSALASYILCPPPSPPPARATRGSAIHVFLVHMINNTTISILFFCRARHMSRKDP